PSSLSFSFFSYASAAPRDLPSFPTRRSSDLVDERHQDAVGDEPGQVLRHDRRLAELHRQRPRLLHRRGGGRLSRDDLDQLHERRSEEHTSELQSLTNLVCRLLLEKKKNTSIH